MLGIHAVFVDTSRPKSRFSVYTSWPLARKWSLILCLHQDPLRGNGHWFFCHIKTLYEAMVIDFFTSKPFARQWSLISFYTSRPSARQRSLISLSHRGPLQRNGHRLLYIKALCEAMVTDFFVYIKTLYEAMVIDLFTSRPSTRQWSSISLHQDYLRGTGHWFLDIKPSTPMVIDFFVTSRPSMRHWSSISLHKDPLWGTGHWFLSIKALCTTMVIDFFVTLRPLQSNGHWFISFWYRLSSRDWSNLFFQKFKKENNKTKWFFGSGPSTW